MQMVAQKQVDEMRMEVSRREQELLQMATKMKVVFYITGIIGVLT